MCPYFSRFLVPIGEWTNVNINHRARRQSLAMRVRATGLRLAETYSASHSTLIPVTLHTPNLGHAIRFAVMPCPTLVMRTFARAVLYFYSKGVSGDMARGGSITTPTLTMAAFLL